MIDLREPLLRVAVKDRRNVTDFDYRVLTLAVPLLSETEGRSMKIEILATPLGVARGSVSKALKRLAQGGFLIRGNRDDEGIWRYRLPRSPEP